MRGMGQVAAGTEHSAQPKADVAAAHQLADDLAQGVIARNRRALSRAITLVESTNPTHEEAANRLLLKAC